MCSEQSDDKPPPSLKVATFLHPQTVFVIAIGDDLRVIVNLAKFFC